MLWKSLIIGIFISSIMFVIALVSNIIGFVFLKELLIFLGPIISIIQILVLFALAYFAGFFYSVLFKEYISKSVMNVSAAIIYITQVVLVLPLAYLISNIDLYIAIMSFLFIALFYILIFFSFVKWCLEKGSNAAIRKVAPELVKKEIFKEKKPVTKIEKKSMFKQSLTLGASISGVLILYSLIASIIVVAFLKDYMLAGAVVPVIQAIILFITTYYAGYYYSKKYNEVIPAEVIRKSALAVYIIQMVYAIPFVLLMFPFKFPDILLFFGLFYFLLIFWNFLIYFSMSEHYLKKGSNLYIKRRAPELMRD